MAHVTIDSGPVDASDALREVPQGKWFELMQVRRDFLGIYLPHDCRRLLEFVEDAEQMHGPLGFANAEDFIRRGLELEPQQVAWALDGLRRMKPDEPIPYAKAIALGKREIGIGGGKAGPGRGKKTPCDASRFPSYGTVEYWLARLDRDGHAELAAQVRAGTMSANAAAEEVGYRKQKSPLEKIQKLWAKLDRTERYAHLEWILKQCATCGHPGATNGTWCDACCEEGMKEELKEMTKEQREMFEKIMTQTKAS